jgi:hypothetical protein
LGEVRAACAKLALAQLVLSICLAIASGGAMLYQTFLG